MLTHFSLFSGIGGIDLAAEWAGFETVGQCEFADYPTKVLEKHWPDVTRWRDICDVTADGFRERTGLRTVDLVSGGFPCQPFSVAGKQKGKGDDRYLWPEMLRVIRELAPRWVVGENVSGILSIAGRTVCEDLEREGYDVTIFNFEAAAVGAPHRRERVFFVGNSKHDGQFTKSELRSNEAASYKRWTEEQTKTGELAGADRPSDVSSIRRSESTSEWETMADTHNEGLQVTGYESEYKTISSDNRIKHRGSNVSYSDNRSRLMWGNGKLSTALQTERTRNNNGKRTPEYVTGQWWTVEPDMGRVAYGIPNRVHRLKCLGNAVVPQQVYPILQAIANIENNEVIK